jgi:hypothetical protein
MKEVVVYHREDLKTLMQIDPLSANRPATGARISFGAILKAGMAPRKSIPKLQMPKKDRGLKDRLIALYA